MISAGHREWSRIPYSERQTSSFKSSEIRRLLNNLRGASGPRPFNIIAPLAPLNASRKPGMSKSRPRSPVPAAEPESPAIADSSPGTRTADASPACPSSTHTRGKIPSVPKVPAPPTHLHGRNPFP